jgi:hypothetical protein
MFFRLYKRYNGVNRKMKIILGYFTPAEYALILLSGIATDLSIRFYPLLIQYPKIVEWFHEVLNLPGPGGGVFLFAGIFLFWAFLLYALVEKKGAILLLTLVMLMTSSFLGNEIGGKNILWNLGWFVIAIACEVFVDLVRKRSIFQRILPAMLAGLSSICFVQIALGMKIWDKEVIWPGMVPIFLVFGIMLALVFLIKRPSHLITAGALGITIYLVYLWLSVFFPPHRPHSIPVLLLTVNVSASVYVMFAIGLAKLLRLFWSSDFLNYIDRQEEVGK